MRVPLPLLLAVMACGTVPSAFAPGGSGGSGGGAGAGGTGGTGATGGTGPDGPVCPSPGWPAFGVPREGGGVVVSTGAQGLTVKVAGRELLLPWAGLPEGTFSPGERIVFEALESAALARGEHADLAFVRYHDFVLYELPPLGAPELPDVDAVEACAEHVRETPGHQSPDVRRWRTCSR